MKATSCRLVRLANVMALASLPVIALCGLARDAAAAVVTLERQHLKFGASPGEANDVTLTISIAPGSTAGEALVSDLGAPLAAEGGCTAVDEHSATCPVTRAGLRLAVALGDGDDAARLVGRIHLQIGSLRTSPATSN